jgi:phosphoserine phosphatase
LRIDRDADQLNERANGTAMTPQPSSAEMIPRAGHTTVALEDPLPSWHEGAAKKSIVEFVRVTTDAASPDYVRPEHRIATFDNDGTLWAEQPYYFQLAFALDQIKAMAPRNPEWPDKEPFKSALTGDAKGLLFGGQRALLEVVAATHFGMTTEEFDDEVRKWLASARHPKTDRPYTDMVFQPMLEVLNYLRANGFKTFIVSGGGIEFMRAFAEQTYGIPHEQVVGSSGKLKFDMRDGKPVLLKLPEVNFIDDNAGKPAGIQQHIGRRPIAAFGNSDGDLQMLQWTTAGKGARFGLLVRHTDGRREWEYDRDSDVGHLDKALDEANEKGWTVVDMKNDWRRIFPFE